VRLAERIAAFDRTRSSSRTRSASARRAGSAGVVESVAGLGLPVGRPTRTTRATPGSRTRTPQSRRARCCSTHRSEASAAVRSRLARPATSQRRTSSTCCTARGIETGIDSEPLIGVAEWLEGVLGRQLEGQVLPRRHIRAGRRLATGKGKRMAYVQARSRRRRNLHRPLPRQRGERQRAVPREDSIDPERPVRGSAQRGWRGSATRRDPRVGAAQHPARHDRRDQTRCCESKRRTRRLITTNGFKQILHLARSQTPGPRAAGSS